MRFTKVTNCGVCFNCRVDTTSYSAGVYGMAHDSRLWITHEFVTLPDHVNVGGQSAMIEHGDIPIASDDSL